MTREIALNLTRRWCSTSAADETAGTSVYKVSKAYLLYAELCHVCNINMIIMLMKDVNSVTHSLWQAGEKSD